MRKTLRIDEFAGLMGVSTRTVRRWIKSGRVPAVRVGQQTVRIPIGYADGLLNEKKLDNRGQPRTTADTR